MNMLVKAITVTKVTVKSNGFEKYYVVWLMDVSNMKNDRARKN